MVGGVRRGYCDTGRLKIAITPAIDRTIAITIAKRGRSTKIRENGFSASIDFLIVSFIVTFFFYLIISGLVAHAVIAVDTYLSYDISSVYCKYNRFDSPLKIF